jgi:hypothetical protein
VNRQSSVNAFLRFFAKFAALDLEPCLSNCRSTSETEESRAAVLDISADVACSNLYRALSRCRRLLADGEAAAA